MVSQRKITDAVTRFLALVVSSSSTRPLPDLFKEFLHTLTDWSRPQQVRFAAAASAKLGLSGSAKLRMGLQSRDRPSELRRASNVQATFPPSVLVLGKNASLFRHFECVSSHILRFTRQLSSLTVKNTMLFYLNMTRKLCDANGTSVYSTANTCIAEVRSPTELLRHCIPLATVETIESAYAAYQTCPRVVRRTGLCIATVTRHMQWCLSLFGRGVAAVSFPPNWISSRRHTLHAEVCLVRKGSPPTSVHTMDPTDVSDDDSDESTTTPGNEHKVFTDNEIAAMLNHHRDHPRNRCILGILFSTGVRLRGLVLLKTSSVFELKAGGLPVVREHAHTVEKRGVKRRLPLAPFVKDALQEYYRAELVHVQTPSPYLFPSCRYNNGHRSQTNIRHMFVRTCVAVGIPRVRMHVHAARHTCATKLHRAGFTLQQVADFLGHMSIETTRTVYIHLSEEEKLRKLCIPWHALLPVVVDDIPSDNQGV